ncbi:MAG: AI-2E family transporter [Patescibacteria group bacterium]
MGHSKVDISTSTFVRLILFLLALWFIFLIRDVLVLLFLVMIIVAGLSPTVDRWAKTITRPGAVISVFLLFVVILGAILGLIIPPFVTQLQEFANNLPLYADQLSRSDSDGFLTEAAKLTVANLNQIASQLSNISGSLFTKTLGVINGLVAMVTVLVLAFYLLLEEEGMKKIYKGIIPNEWYDDLAETTRKIAGRLGAWLRGQLFLMFIVGFAVTIGLLIVGSPYALSLGIWAGLTEAIPIVGPWLGAVPGVAVGLAESPLQGFLTLLVYLVIQQLEGNILVPKIMSKAVGLNPVIVIIAILIGGKLYGLMGVVLAVPLAAVVSVITEDWHIIRQTFSNSRDK